MFASLSYPGNECDESRSSIDRLPAFRAFPAGVGGEVVSASEAFVVFLMLLDCSGFVESSPHAVGGEEQEDRAGDQEGE